MTKRSCMAWKRYKKLNFLTRNGPEVRFRQHQPLEFSKLQTIARYGTKMPPKHHLNLDLCMEIKKVRIFDTYNGLSMRNNEAQPLDLCSTNFLSQESPPKGSKHLHNAPTTLK